MTNGRRGILGTKYDIVKAIADGHSKPTKIMSMSNVSWGPMMKFMEELISDGLIVEIDSSCGDRRSRVIYKITEDGKFFVKYLGRFV